MAKSRYFNRYGILIGFLETQSATFEEIEARMLQTNDSKGYSIKTFQRDCEDVEEIYKKKIEYNRTTKSYQIRPLENFIQSNYESRLMDIAHVSNALQLYTTSEKWIDLEQRRSLGLNNMYGIMHALEQKVVISFKHSSYWKEPKDVTVQPLGLKESKNRWYMAAKDLNDQRIKTYGLDRISDIKFPGQKFTPPKDFNIHNLFKDSIGVIIGNEDEKPEEVILKFTHDQGKYIKSLPLHSSQEVIADNAEEYRVKLRVYLTFDLEMEILSLGETVEVIAPERFRKRIIDRLNETSAQYN